LLHFLYYFLFAWRACCAFQLNRTQKKQALWSLLFNRIRKADGLSQLNFHSVQTLTALSNFELNLVVVTDFVDQLGNVNEDIFASLVHFDETKTLGLIEKFYSSCLHGTFVMDVF
jgi:hypothetical protein